MKDETMSRLHKVFISYHHANDENYRNIFERRFGNKFRSIIPSAVQLGDIPSTLKTETIRQKIRDEYLRDASVTVVLIGTETWKRKHVDWEIGATLRATKHNARGGLLGILLPTHPSYSERGYDAGLIPPRLEDNVESGYAAIYDWSNDAADVQDWVHKAYLRKNRETPTNARDPFVNNRNGERWR